MEVAASASTENEGAEEPEGQDQVAFTFTDPEAPVVCLLK